MRILIVGAGVGGLATARGLIAAGHDVDVWERAPQLRTGGAAMTIFSNGAAALAQLGRPIDHLGSSTTAYEFRRQDGRVLARADLRHMVRRCGFPVLTVPRADLVNYLAADLPPEMVHYGRDLASVTVGHSGVEVTDAEGARHRADVLIGADGYRSTVRSQIHGDTGARPTGWTSWQGVGEVHDQLAQGTVGIGMFGVAGACGFMPAGAGKVQWWFHAPGFPEDPAPPSPVGMLRSRFADYCAPADTVLAAITDQDVGRYPHVVHRVSSRWGSGPTTLLGDAAHAFPPNQAQGANQAFEDAWLLTRALSSTSRSAELPASLRRYERIRARRVRPLSQIAAMETIMNKRPPSGAHILPDWIATRGLTTLVRLFSNEVHQKPYQTRG